MSFNLTRSRRWRLHETTSVQGCVYEMSRDAYEALWRSEGGAMKKTPYQEVVVSVRDPATQRTVDAITCQVARSVEEGAFGESRRWRIGGGDVAMAYWWGRRHVDGVLVGET